ncbi:hypothetical protein [Actinoplanes missouriensis]|nr:hypothetical protein [Actinoplanes missouriensis]
MDSAWWSVWWPWMLIWAATVITLVATCWTLFARWRMLRGRGQPVRGITFYLHDDSVMDLYLGGTYKRALREEVREEISSTKEANVNAAFQNFGVGGGRTVDRKVFRDYIETAEPITVIRIIMEVLEKADDIVYIDLVNGAIEPGRALTKALRTTVLTDPASFTVRELGQLESYVSVRGTFRMAAESGDTVIFEAPCGERQDGGVVQALFRCSGSGIRRDVPEGEFQARCLGKVQTWDRQREKLIIDPIAIFQ